MTKRILIPLGLTLLILLTISIVSIYWLQRMHLDEKIEIRLEDIGQLFQMKLSEDAKVLESQINLLQLDQNIQKAYQAKEREALLYYAMPFFEAIRTKYQVTHFYFLECHGAKANTMHVHVHCVFAHCATDKRPQLPCVHWLSRAKDCVLLKWLYAASILKNAQLLGTTHLRLSALHGSQRLI